MLSGRYTKRTTDFNIAKQNMLGRGLYRYAAGYYHHENIFVAPRKRHSIRKMEGK